MREALIIDLGEDWELGEVEDVHRPVDPQRRRRAVQATFISMVVVAAFMGGTKPGLAESAVHQLTLFPYPGTRGTIAIAGDLVLVAAGGGQLTAFEFDGKQRWRARLDDLISVTSIYVMDGLILVTANRGLESTAATIAIEPATGRQAWRMPGEVEPAGAYAVLSFAESDLTVLGSGDLVKRWTLTDVLAHLVRGQNVLVLKRNGAFEERDLATGSVLRAQQLALPTDFHGRIVLSRDMLLVVGSSGGGLGATEQRFWFDAKTFEPASSGTYWAEWRDCGDVWCGRVRGGSRMAIVDKATNILLRQLPEGQSAVGTPAGLMTVVFCSEGCHTALELVDPKSGRRRANLAGWHTVSANTSEELTWFLIWPANGTSHVAQLRHGGMRVLGKVQGEMFGCRLEASLLLCWTIDGKLGLWRIDLT